MLRIQYAQSAAPPAMVATMCEDIGKTFFTVLDPIYFPIDALESIQTITDSLFLNATVVVPWYCKFDKSSLVLNSVGFFEAPIRSKLKATLPSISFSFKLFE
mmetsp:Transcript_9030/g.12356  ORF Transcript_9030/g.12356 Transcript_9030/m.12356 type:complete len:102 (-) Transcript_9030:102-407(-)